MTLLRLDGREFDRLPAAAVRFISMCHVTKQYYKSSAVVDIRRQAPVGLYQRLQRRQTVTVISQSLLLGPTTMIPQITSNQRECKNILPNSLLEMRSNAQPPVVNANAPAKFKTQKR